MKIGIIGSGFGGLISAAYLTKAGHDVHIYEQFSRIGGVLLFTSFYASRRNVQDHSLGGALNTWVKLKEQSIAFTPDLATQLLP